MTSVLTVQDLSSSSLKAFSRDTNPVLPVASVSGLISVISSPSGAREKSEKVTLTSLTDSPV